MISLKPTQNVRFQSAGMANPFGTHKEEEGAAKKLLEMMVPYSFQVLPEDLPKESCRYSWMA